MKYKQITVATAYKKGDALTGEIFFKNKALAKLKGCSAYIAVQQITQPRDGQYYVKTSCGEIKLKAATKLYITHLEEVPFWERVEAAHAWGTRVKNDKASELSAFLSIFHPELSRKAHRDLVEDVRSGGGRR